MSLPSVCTRLLLSDIVLIPKGIVMLATLTVAVECVYPCIGGLTCLHGRYAMLEQIATMKRHSSKNEAAVSDLSRTVARLQKKVGWRATVGLIRGGYHSSTA